MDATTKEIIFDILTDEQVNEILLKMEDMAQKKLANIEAYYHSKITEETDFPDEVLSLINNGDWYHFLPAEYHPLKLIQRNEEAKRKAS